MRTYSYSQLDSFRQCPLKFKLKYLDRVETGVESVELFLGNRVHEVLEKLYRDLWGRKLNNLNDLLDFYGDRWDDQWHPGVFIVRSRGMGYFDYGVKCIRNYYRENYPFDQSRTISLEEPVEFELNWKRGRCFRGRVDRVSSCADGFYEIHDYKTGRTYRAGRNSKMTANSRFIRLLFKTCTRRQKKSS
jgi:RecB family exonuclease